MGVSWPSVLEIHQGICLELWWCWEKLGQPPALKPPRLEEGSEPLPTGRTWTNSQGPAGLKGCGSPVPSSRKGSMEKIIWGMEFPWLWAGLCPGSCPAARELL